MVKEIGVLDKGFVRLVDSMPISDGDSRIVQAARVSYGAGTKTLREDTGLIKYLIRNKHTSPLEKVVFEFHVKCPISVARQWQRHRTWAYNEVSTRYSEVEDEIYLPAASRMKTQDKKNRQGSGEALEEELAELCLIHMTDVHSFSYKRYQKLLELGLAREAARDVLPLATYTQFYGTVNLHNLLGFLQLRLDAHAQYEIREYAQALLDLARPIAPITITAWEEING